MFSAKLFRECLKNMTSRLTLVTLVMNVNSKFSNTCSVAYWLGDLIWE